MITVKLFVHWVVHGCQYHCVCSLSDNVCAPTTTSLGSRTLLEQTDATSI